MRLICDIPIFLSSSMCDSKITYIKKVSGKSCQSTKWKKIFLCRAFMYNLTFSMYLPHLPFNIVVFRAFFERCSRVCSRTRMTFMTINLRLNESACLDSLRILLTERNSCIFDSFQHFSFFQINQLRDSSKMRHKK